MKFRFLFSLMLGASLTAAAQGYQDGVDNYNANRSDIAKEILTNTLNNPGTDKAVSYYYLGCIDFAENNLAGAKANFDKGYQANPSYAYNLIGQGEVILKQGDKSSAEKLFDQAMKLDKKNTAVIATVARAYWNVDPVKYKKEIDKYIAKAFKESKNTEPAVYMLQGDMVAKTDAGEAAGLYEMAIAQDKNKGNVNREAYVKYAHVYDVHNRPLVIQMLEELNELEPNSGLAQRELAEQYYENNQLGRAWKSYEKYVQNPNHFRRDEQRYTGLLVSAGEYNKAIEWADKVLAAEPTSYPMYRMKMLSYTELKNDSLAALSGDKLFNFPGAYLVNNDYIKYGNALVNVNRGEDAVKVYEAGMNAVKDDSAKYLSYLPLLAKAHQKAGNAEKAIELQSRYLDSGAASASDYYALYTSYMTKAREAEDEAVKAENFNNAEKYINLAIEKDPRQITYLYRKVALDFTRNHNKLSESGFETINKFFELYASYPQASSGMKNMAASLYMMEGIDAMRTDKAKAHALFLKGLEYTPENENLIKYAAETEE